MTDALLKADFRKL